MDSKYRYKLLQSFAPPFIDDGKEEPDSHVVECCVKIPVAVVYKKGIAIYHKYKGNDYYRLVPLSLEKLVDKHIIEKTSKK